MVSKAGLDSCGETPASRCRLANVSRIVGRATIEILHVQRASAPVADLFDGFGEPSFGRIFRLVAKPLAVMNFWQPSQSVTRGNRSIYCETVPSFMRKIAMIWPPTLNSLIMNSPSTVTGRTVKSTE